MPIVFAGGKGALSRLLIEMRADQPAPIASKRTLVYTIEAVGNAHVTGGAFCGATDEAKTALDDSR